MGPVNENTFIAHLEALRHTLLKCVTLSILMYPIGYFLTPQIIQVLVQWSLPEHYGLLHFFSPAEVFWVQLKMGLLVALTLAYPWNVYQIWRFLMPGLYLQERRMLGLWIVASSLLFFGGIAFCIWQILPLLMNFSMSFASDHLQPMIGLSNFLELAGWLSIAFGVMFQSPILVLLAVHFGFVSCETLRKKRPYVMVGILIAAALLTPPDVVSQLLLAIPTWLLFEVGLFAAARIVKNPD